MAYLRLLLIFIFFYNRTSEHKRSESELGSRLGSELESVSGSESESELGSESNSESEFEPELELELEMGSVLAGYESEWLTQYLKDKYRKGLVILLYCYIISLLISQYILCNFTPTNLLSFMLAKEKGTSSGSGNFMRNAEADSSKNKRSFTGNSKAGKKDFSWR